MLVSTVVILFAAAALAAPVDQAVSASIRLGSAAIPSELLYQGDGYYKASYNESGHINVAFTPIAELSKRFPTKEYVANGSMTRRQKMRCG